MGKTLIQAVVIIVALLGAIVLFVLPPLASISQQAAATDKVRSEVLLTHAQADKAIAEARKINAEAHRLENELDRDKFGWTAVTIKESGIGGLGQVAVVIGFVVVVGGLVLAIALMVIKPKSDW